MNELSFDSIYKKLFDNTINTEENRIENILLNDSDYYKINKSKEEKFKEFEVKTKEKKYGSISYGIYMMKCPVIKDFLFDENYNIIEQPDEYFYEATMIATKEDKNGVFSINHIMEIRNKDKNIVQERYDYLSDILDKYTEQQLLNLINIEIDKQIAKDNF